MYRFAEPKRRIEQTSLSVSLLLSVLFPSYDRKNKNRNNLYISRKDNILILWVMCSRYLRDRSGSDRH